VADRKKAEAEDGRNVIIDHLDNMDQNNSAPLA
jgi:hypothetical protein